MTAEQKHPAFARADRFVVRVCKYTSYPSAILLMIVAVIATVNVITSKTIKWIVPSNMDWITYLLIPIVFLGLAHVQLDRGLVVVDFLSNHYPGWLQKGLDVVCNALLIALNGFIGYRAFVLMSKNFQIGVISSTDAGHFYMWPFNFLLGLGMIMFAFTSFWTILRTFTGVKTNRVLPSNAEAEQLPEPQDETGGDNE